MQEKEKILSGKKKETSPAARTVYVSLDRADAIIDGCPTDGWRVAGLYCIATCGYSIASRRHAMQNKKSFAFKGCPTRLPRIIERYISRSYFDA
jgi:hypothetical protein